MKKNRILSFLSAGVLLLTGACSNEILDQGKGNDQKDIDPSEGVFMAVNFDLPTAKETRSYTDDENSSNSGTEIGQEYENKVRNVAIVLTSYSNEFIAYSLSQTIDPVGTSGRSYRTTNKFEKTALGIYYGQEEMFAIDQNTGNHKINVYVFCNPTPGLLKKLGDIADPDVETNEEWYDIQGSWDESLGDVEEVSDIIWTKDNFLMSNASVATRLIPASIDDWDAYSSETTPFNLSGMNNFGRPNQVDNLTDRGNIEVERTAARYDFRDGALDYEKYPDDETYNGFAAQTYHVVLDSNKQPLVDVYLGKMSIVNMNKNYFYLRRVSANGRPYYSNNDWELCGPELPWYSDAFGNYLPQPGNYVVDADAEWKYYGTHGNHGPTEGYKDKFNFPFFEEGGKKFSNKWKTYLISDVLAGPEDNPDSWNLDKRYGTYKIWRYLTEGTIPGINSQKNSVSNGIVFKGQMLPNREANSTDDVYTKKLLNALKVVEEQSDEQVSQNHLLFYYGGHLYCGWQHIRRMAIQLAITDLRKEDGKWVCSINRSVGLYNAVYGTGGFGEVTFQIDGDDVESANLMIEGEGNATLTDVMTKTDDDSPNAKYEKWQHNGYETDEYYAFRNAVVEKNIRIYQETYDEELGGWAYYCNYYYWNRHNDNGKNGIMGPMEFAVVRNNVYKIAVTSIKNIGHPRITINDPDKPTPDTDDEIDDVFISVDVDVLPWVVRINNAVF